MTTPASDVPAAIPGRAKDGVTVVPIGALTL